MRALLLVPLLAAACRSPEPPADPGQETPPTPTTDQPALLDTPDAAAATQAAPPTDPALENADPNSPRALDPMTFLDRLVAAAEGGAGGGTTTDEFPVAGWIEPHHIPLLLDRLDSEAAALHVVQTKCSIFPSGLSTEGLQAQFMLDAVRVGVYPPMLSSEYAQHGEPASYAEWWERLRRIEALPLPTDASGAITWDTFGPCDLLDVLCRHAGSAARLPAHPPYAWIRDADAAQLIERVASPRPCAALIVHRLPERAPPPSTEGATARMLLHLYREAAAHRHHASLGTPHDTEFEQDPDAWRAWWAEWVERPRD